MPKQPVASFKISSRDNLVWLKDRLSEPDFQEDFARIGDKLRERLDADFTVFSPEASADSSAVVDKWLQQYKPRFLMLLPDVFFEQYPGLRSEYQGGNEIADLAHRIYDSQIVRESLRRYALRRLALWWSASKYPDATGIGEPEKHGGSYYVPVFSLRDNRRIGRVTLTPSGMVVLSETSTGQELRQALIRAA